MDKEGNDKNAEGEVYGDILVRAYLDEEYFEHLHGGNAKGEVGWSHLFFSFFLFFFQIIYSHNVYSLFDTKVLLRYAPASRV